MVALATTAPYRAPPSSDTRRPGLSAAAGVASIWRLRRRVEGRESKENQEILLVFCSVEGGKRRSAPEGKESCGSRMEGRAVRAQVAALDGMKRKNGLSACLVREFWEVGYCSTFVFILQLVFNHGLIRLKTFVSQFPTKLCN